MIADSIPSSGWAFSTYESLARYGTNYYGLRNRIAILSEAFSHDPFARRVASTYDFVSEILSYLAEHKTRDPGARPRRRREGRRVGEASAGSSPPLSLKSRMDTTRMEDVRVEQIVPLTDSTKREAGMGSAAAHRHREARAHAGDGELHADAHRHAAVRLRVRHRGGRGAAADPRGARHRRRPARRAGDRHGASLRRGQRDRARPFGDVAHAQGRHRQVDARRRRVRWPRAATSSAPGNRADSPRSTCSSPRARTAWRSGASSTASSRRTPISPIVRVTKPATLSFAAPRATDASIDLAVPVEPAARFPVRSEQQAGQAICATVRRRGDARRSAGRGRGAQRERHHARRSTCSARA